MSLTVADVQQAKRRDDLVPGYAAWIRDLGVVTPADVAGVNRAIVKRWSLAALSYIKKRAWREAGFR